MFADKKICSRDPKAEEDMENNSGPQELFPVQYAVAIEKLFSKNCRAERFCLKQEGKQSHTLTL